ncbi:N-acetylneuraminate synthase family protein [Candidatus Uhrbacteria bacterium]|nr:N-acetylneuraminate synthase family protein [Candidatus Uhrbacteria bacterium]
MLIGSHDTKKRIFIMAEIGNNHEGNFDVAVKMIEAAAGAGADAVKFQTIVPERFVRPADTKRMEQLKRFAFSYEQFSRLKEVAENHGVLFLSTPFDLESAAFLDSLVPAFKIASGDNNFSPLIEVIARTGKPIILSTGVANLEELKRVHSFIKDIWRAQRIDQTLAFLHCVASYPVPPDEANLAAISTLANAFPDCEIGYSDHTQGIQAAVVAAALGARIIEKHFTLDHHYSEFRDHQLSADPTELAALVKGVRQVEALLGNGVKEPQKCEAEMIKPVRRSIVAARDLAQGIVVGKNDITWMRPGDGLAPGQEHLIIGKTLIKPVAKGVSLTLDIFT